MAVILAYGSPALGHLYPMAALLRELAVRGHRVHLRTMASGVGAMRRHGLHAEPVDPRIEAIVSRDWLAPDSLSVLKMTLDVLCRRAVLEVEELNNAIERVRPDALVVDANCWGAISAAEASASNGPAWCVFSPFTPYLSSRYAPPFGPGLRPLPGLVGRVRDASMRPFVRHLLDRPVSPRINTIRRQLGIPPIDSVDALMRRAPMLLAVGGEPFEYPHPDWGDAVHFLGACAFEPDAAAAAPAWLSAIERPIVLVSTSSVAQADAKLGEVALRALADAPVHVVATFPAGIPTGLPRTPNATVCRFVPHSAVLDRAICAVTHGGMGTTVKALDRGVPVCAVPFARDQAEVARRVQVAGCGTRLPAKHLTVKRLRRAVLTAATLGEGARRVAAGFAATGGVARGADLIEQRLLSGIGATSALPDAGRRFSSGAERKLAGWG
ncbi:MULTISPECIES: glycosyltransferase [Mycobacterium]|uniref:glycosyltransferase n=1 Tax=Mycobacterium TaxID=1763 RepID=UPI001EF0BAB3|nr:MULTISPECIES: glycosyltransferase [Mycobacterium]BDB41350.1 glycosyl transferase [Mycobacterium kiyosense]BDE13104.1 glycosyl transferase [Mycobacterium sp. 20KCMC460]GLB89573.1 glycosyl transferase [Mycobacterium kiyosense]GLC02334.1 glycosyl transferase [Mycobacterium kiyosense]GLC13031.1 glycosyl transferase [Mycobacterium kiyosense]